LGEKNRNGISVLRGKEIEALMFGGYESWGNYILQAKKREKQQQRRKEIASCEGEG